MQKPLVFWKNLLDLKQKKQYNKGINLLLRFYLLFGRRLFLV